MAQNGQLCDYSQKQMSGGGKLVRLRPSPNIIFSITKALPLFVENSKHVIFEHMYYDPSKGTSFRDHFNMGPSWTQMSNMGKVPASLLLPDRRVAGNTVLVRPSCAPSLCMDPTRRRNWKLWRCMYWRSFERGFRPSLVHYRLFLNQLISKDKQMGI